MGRVRGKAGCVLLLLGVLFELVGPAGSAVASESPIPAAPASVSPTEWVTGTKKVLVIRIRFPDEPAVDPITEAELAPAWQQAKDQLPEFSYGQFAFDPTLVVSPTVTMPNASTFYAGKIWSEELLADARAAAAALGPLWDSANYHLDIVISNSPGSTAGAIGTVGGKGIYGTGGPAKIQFIAHELGHNLGLPHGSSAYFGHATFGPLKAEAATLVEYGDSHDLMGDSKSTGGSPKYHFNPLQKYLLGWIGDGAVEAPVASGTYRIHAHDVASLPPGAKVALRLPHSPQEELWWSFRQKWVENPWSVDGAEVHLWHRFINTFGYANPANTIRLDPTPGSPFVTGDPQYMEDATLLVGRTFFDPWSKVYVTPIGKGGTTPESLDLVVNFGPFPANVPPTAALGASAGAVAIGAPVTFTATASDTNGDPLAWAWDFGDGSFAATNAPAATKSWGAAGVYTVTCIVSDMKGGETRRTIAVTVGAPVVNSISGTVRDALGNPMAGVHVHNGLQSSGYPAYRGTYTRDDGTYTITNLPAGSFTLTAGKDHSVFSRDGGWTNPVTVGPPASVVGRDFRRSGGLVSITGRVQSGPFGALTPGVTVRVEKSDGTSVDLVSDAGGVWQINVPQGLTKVTAIPPAGSGWTIGEAWPLPGGAFPNPWVINVGGTAIDKLNFYFRTPDLAPVGFDSASSVVFENVGQASIPVSVTRSSGTNLNMVQKIAAGGTATGGGVDHFHANGAFLFPAISPPGPPQTQTRTITFPVIDDGVAEPNETVKLSLVVTQVTYQPTITSHTVTLVDADMALDSTSVAENQPSGTAVGSFLTGSPDLSSSFTYTLVAGAGSADNASFSVTGRTLRTAASFDFETKSSYSVRLRCTNAGGGFFEEPFTISVVDLSEGPGTVAGGGDPAMALGVAKNVGNPTHLDLAWGASCGGGTTDYALYEGTMGAFTGHLPMTCSTGGTSALDRTPGAGDRYFLVVPRSLTAEGSYGTDGSGAEIPPSSAPCLATQELSGCP